MEDLVINIHTNKGRDRDRNNNGNGMSSNIKDEYGIEYSADKSRLIKAPTNITGDIVIPRGVKVIDDYAFANCIGMRSVVIPSTCKRLGNYAFANCIKLVSVVWND